MKPSGVQLASPILPPDRVTRINSLAQTWIEDVFGDAAQSIELTSKDFIFRYHSPAHFVEVFRTLYGPVHKAFLALDEAGQSALEADILNLIAMFNTATDGSMRVPAAYVEITIVKA